MLQVSGVVGISGQAPVEKVKGEKGSFFNFIVVSPDPETGKTTSYNASMWVPHAEVAQWTEELQGGNVFYLSLGSWAMQEYEGGKYPIPKLKINRYTFKRMYTPYWLAKGE